MTLFFRPPLIGSVLSASGLLQLKHIPDVGSFILVPPGVILGVAGGPDTVTLKSSDALIPGVIILVQDEAGTAGSSPITIDTEGSETINGLPDTLITENFGWVLLYANSDGDWLIWGRSNLGRKVSGAANIDSTGALILAVTDTTAVRTVTLKTADLLLVGQPKLIQDESGAASVNNISLITEGSAKINGAVSDSISTDFGNIKVYPDGTDWIIESRR